MHMRKILLFTASLLCAASMWAQVTEGPWTLVHYTTQEKPKIANDSIAFNNGYSGESWGSVDRVTDANGFGFNWTGTSPADRMRGTFAVFEIQDAVVPPYTSMNVNWAFKLRSKSTKHYSTVCLYGVPCSRDSIQNLKVPFTNRFDQIEDKSTIQGLLAWYYNESYSKNVESSETLSATLSFDNRAGSTEQTKEWSMMMTYIVGSADSKSTEGLNESGYFKSLYIDTTWTYFKIVTFDANGGEGSMDKDTIENSGHLTSNAFTREGYYFMGWATSSDGAVEYADGAEITATKEDKGPVTLYAVWQQIITAVPTPKLGMVYNGEEKTLINAGTAVGGTMQYSLDNIDWSDELPKATNAGTYTVYYKVVGDASHADYTPENNTVTAKIDKATATYTTRPAAIPYLKANGQPQELVTEGEANAGLMRYKLSSSDSWMSSPPKATEAGNYYVCYFINADMTTNYQRTKVDTLIATIHPTGSPVPADENYDASKITVLDAQQGANTGLDVANRLFDGNRATKWCSFTNDIKTYSERPKDMVVWRTEGFVKMVSYTLTTGNDTQTYPNRNWSSWTLYGGSFESDDDATAALHNEGAWTIIDNQIQDTVLKAFNDSNFQFACNNPGWYKYYRLVIHDIKYVQGEKQDNIQQMAELTMGVTTFTPPIYVTRPSAKAYLKHSGNAQELINAGSVANGGTVLYKLGNGEWSTDVPQATDSGNYYVYYKIQKTELYPESDPETLITTIYGNKTVPVHDNYPYGGISVLAKQEGVNTDGSQRADRLFNGDADSDNRYYKWCSVTTGIEKYEDRPKDIVVWKTAKAIEMISYELRIGNDAEDFKNRNWYSWTIYGGEFESDDAARAALTTEKGWKIIDNQINDTVLEEKNLERYNFVCNNPGTYKYYRLVIHALHVTDSAKTQGVQQMSELTMGIEHVVPAYQTRPSAKANLQYSGENQTLIEAGTPTTGTILYQLENGKWSETLPQASAKGNYYVYYKINGSEIAPDTLIATIYGDRTVPEHDDYSYSNISVLAKQEGSDTSDDQRADKLFNGNDQTGPLNKWCSESKGIAKYEDRPKDIVVWKTASDIEMISYQLKTGNDTQQYPNRNWYSWTIYGGSFGSDDAAAAAMLNEGAWTIIDNQIKDAVLEERNNAQYNFACNNPGTYQYYRLVIHALHVTDSAKTQGVQQMQELTMGIEKATPPTGVEEANANGKAVKVLRDGQLFILREGKKYNAQGVLVESRK